MRRALQWVRMERGREGEERKVHKNGGKELLELWMLLTPLPKTGSFGPTDGPDRQPTGRVIFGAEPGEKGGKEERRLHNRTIGDRRCFQGQF